MQFAFITFPQHNRIVSCEEAVTRTIRETIMTDYQRLIELVTPACEQYGVRELSLFGSQARGDSHEKSDFDFVVSFNKSQEGKLSDRFFGLLFYLEDHLSQQIDLLEQEAIRNPYLREAINAEKKVIYGARTEKAVV
jgi:predicted nucleotidyltransferase